MTASNRKALLISLGFNGYWLLCVMMQSEALIFLSLVLLAAVVFDRSTLLVAPVIALTGIAVDLALTAVGVFSFATGSSAGPVAAVSHFPVWLVFLWLGFASFAWLMRRIVLETPFALLVAVCGFAGASSYYAGFKLSAVSFPMGLNLTLVLLVAVWLVLGAVFTLAIRFISQQLLKEPLGPKPVNKNGLNVDIRY